MTRIQSWATDWRTMVTVLLMAAALGLHGAGMDAFSNDEIRSVIVAGGAHYGPLPYPGGLIERLSDESPDQAFGFPLVARPWGELVGWSELATRVLPVLAGLVTIAITYRIGSSLMSPLAGLSAALILSTSAIYIAYMHKFRVYTLGSMAGAGLMWCYWRLVYSVRMSWLAGLGFVLCGIGLLYSHYFMAPLAGSLVLYHIIIAPKNRRWWRPVLLSIPIALVFGLQLPTLLEGIAFNQDKPRLGDLALEPLGVIGLFGHYFSNGHWLLLVGMLALALYAIWRGQQRRTLIFVALMALAFLAQLAILNEIVQVIEPRRVRYLMGTWVPFALLVAAGIAASERLRQWLPAVLLVVWAGLGLSAVYGAGLSVETGNINANDWRGVRDLLQQAAKADDAVVFLGHYDAFNDHYLINLPNKQVIAPYTTMTEWDSGQLAAVQRLWLLDRLEISNPNREPVADAIQAADLAACGDAMQLDGFSLGLYARSAAHCPGGQIRASFGTVAELSGLSLTITDDTLTVASGWQGGPDYQPHTYSVVYFLLDNDDNIISQMDLGLDQADFIPQQVTLAADGPDLSDLRLGIAVYRWQDGSRLSVRSDTYMVLDAASLLLVPLQQ